MTEASEWAGRVRTIRAKTTLLSANDRAEKVFVLTSGMLSRERLLDDGYRQIVGVHVPGDVCGLSTIRAGIVNDDVVALSRSTVIEVGLQSLFSSAQLSGDLMQAIWREMALEIGLSAAWTINCGARSAYRRIAHLACELAARLAGQEAESGFKWPGSQADLGAATGLSVVHVNRTLSRMVSERVLTRDRRLYVCNMEKLRDIASFDDAYLQVSGDRLGKMLLAGVDDHASSRQNGFHSETRDAQHQTA